MRTVAWRLPQSLVYWCGIRIWANASEDRGASRLMMVDCLDMWDNDVKRENGLPVCARVRK